MNVRTRWPTLVVTTVCRARAALRLHSASYLAELIVLAVLRLGAIQCLPLVSEIKLKYRMPCCRLAKVIIIQEAIYQLIEQPSDIYFRL